eukprot:Opistho-2@56217
MMHVTGVASAVLSNVTAYHVFSRDGDGGAFAVEFASALSLANVTVGHASTPFRGGVAYVGGTARLTAVGLVSVGSMSAEGGLLHIAAGAFASVTDAHISVSSADGNGGCMYSKSPRVVITGGHYSDCEAGAVEATYGQGGFLYYDAAADEPALNIHGVRLDRARAASAPVVFSSKKLPISGDEFASVEAITSLFGNASASVTTPAAALVFQLSTNTARRASDDIGGGPPAFTSPQLSGDALPNFSVFIQDSYGLAAFAPPTVPLAIRLTIKGNGTTTCTISGDLTRTFSRSSRVDYSNVRVSSSTVPVNCTIGVVPDNFLYSEGADLFKNMALQTVQLTSCSAGTSLQPDAA